MKKTNESGFTLIELLVVISIIGLLSTMAVVSLNSARQKSRDAKRMSDVRQLVSLMSMASSNDPGAVFEGCSGVNASTTSCTGPNEVAQFSNFKDPSAPTVACSGLADTICQYSIVDADASTVSSTTIQFYLENGSGDVSNGPHVISAAGVIN